MLRLATAAVALTFLLGSVGAAVADEDRPTQQEVDQARDAVSARAGDVSAVRAELALANSRVEQAAVEAARTAEAYNGARYRARQARAKAKAADAAAAASEQDSQQQRQVYADTITASYQLAPELSALRALAEADGISQVLETTSTVQNAQQAMDARYDSYRAAATLAQVTADSAERAHEEAEAGAEEARQLREQAAASADSAAAEAAAVAEEKTRLIADLARLEGVSVDLAQRRQAALEEEAAAAAAAAAQQAAVEQEPPVVEQEPPVVEQEPPVVEQEGAPAPTVAETPAPDKQPQPVVEQEGAPAPTVAETPAPDKQPKQPQPGSGASAAIAFARAQIGEPYRWGADGPSSWDCSGLTMAAWSQGGKSLPHYSVAQYEQSTPISVGQLQPGDLVFWGDSGDPSSIYHVALYTGNGQIIHAPRTGRPVTEQSMYYWTAPNFFARP